MNDVQMTIVGNVVDTPKLRRTKSGHYVANFRVASTPRRFDRETNAWTDGETLFVTVTCWRAMGENVAQSLRKGQPVIVHGPLLPARVRARRDPAHGLRARGHRDRARPQPRRRALREGVPLGDHDRGGDRRGRASRRTRAITTSTSPTSPCSRSTRTPGRCASCSRPAERWRPGPWRSWSRPGASASATTRAAGTLVDGSRAGPARCQLRAVPRTRTDSGSVHLHDVQGAQGARRQGDSRRRHPVVPARREDRRRRPERRRQVQRPQDHGRAGPGVQRRRHARGRRQRRPAAAGTAAGRDEDGARQRRGRRGRPARRRWPASKRSRRRWASPTPTSTSCSPSRAS